RTRVVWRGDASSSRATALLLTGSAARRTRAPHPEEGDPAQSECNSDNSPGYLLPGRGGRFSTFGLGAPTLSTQKGRRLSGKIDYCARAHGPCPVRGVGHAPGLLSSP